MENETRQILEGNVETEKPVELIKRLEKYGLSFSFGSISDIRDTLKSGTWYGKKRFCRHGYAYDNKDVEEAMKLTEELQKKFPEVRFEYILAQNPTVEVMLTGEQAKSLQ